MPRFENDPTKVTAGFIVYPADTYEFLIGEPKAFYRTNKKDEPSYGIRVKMTIAEGEFKGKPFMHTLYQQSEGAQSVSKQFLMAALGYGKGRTEEERFNNDYRGKDWGFDTDSGACGDMWREMTGKRIIGQLAVKTADDGSEQQDTKAWLPYGN